MPCKTDSMIPRLKEIREAKRPKLEQIAADLEVAISTVSRLESGETNNLTKRLGENSKSYLCRLEDIFAEPGGKDGADNANAGSRPGAKPSQRCKVPDYLDTLGSGSVQIKRVDLCLSMDDSTNIDEFFETSFKFNTNLLSTITRTPPHRVILRGAMVTA